ncbi:MAG: DUF6062 family protein [Stygiobacter sp.]|jgi:hypothetical protein
MEKILQQHTLKERIFKKLTNQSGCPLCSLIIDFEFSLLAKIQYNITQNDSFRKQIAMEGGFCDFHFKQFKKIANFKTNALLLKSLLEFGIHKDVFAEINCQLCKEINQFENELINYTAELFNDIDFYNRYKKSNGFCVIHLKGMLSNIKDEEIKRKILQIHREQIDNFKPILEMMNSVKSYFDIDISKRGLINVIIQKLVGRKATII